MNRMEFVEFWAKYVREHSDTEWSRQQNKLINAALKSANMSKEVYLAMKK